MTTSSRGMTTEGGAPVGTPLVSEVSGYAATVAALANTKKMT
jgi:hypothetical protein